MDEANCDVTSSRSLAVQVESERHASNITSAVALGGLDAAAPACDDSFVAAALQAAPAQLVAALTTGAGRPSCEQRTCRPDCPRSIRACHPVLVPRVRWERAVNASARVFERAADWFHSRCWLFHGGNPGTRRCPPRWRCSTARGRSAAVADSSIPYRFRWLPCERAQPRAAVETPFWRAIKRPKVVTRRR